MISPLYRAFRALLALVFAVLTLFAAAAPVVAQEKKVAQKNGVDISKMGAYRALAQHMYADFQKGDLAAAAELGTILEDSGTRRKSTGAIPRWRRPTAKCSMKSIKPWICSSPRSRNPKANHPIPPR